MNWNTCGFFVTITYVDGAGAFKVFTDKFFILKYLF